MNQVSDCCHREIVQAARMEFPLGGSTFGIPYTEPICTCCGKDCAEVDQCEICGVVGCLGDCDIIQAEEERLRMMGIVDISEEDFKEFKEVPCKLCNGNGYHYGFGSDGRSPDWCTNCGGNGIEFVDISDQN